MRSIRLGLRLGLRVKFTLLIVFVLTTIFVVVAVILLRNTSGTLRADLVNQAKSFAELATKPIGDAYLLYQDSGRIKILQQVDQFTALNPDITNVSVIDTQGEVVFNQQTDSRLQPDLAAVTRIEPTFVNDEAGRLANIYYPFVEDFGLHRYTVVYSVSHASVDASVTRSAQQILLFSFTALAVSAFATYQLVSWLFLRPIRQVSLDAMRISAGQLDRQVLLDRRVRDELVDLAGSVNRMAESLKADIVKLQEVSELKDEFIIIASHNLRTPIGKIRSALELISEPKITPEQRQQFLGIVQSSIERLYKLTEDMISLISIESGKAGLHLAKTDVQQLAEKVIAELQPVARAKNVKIQLQADQPLTAELDTDKVERILAELVDNAVKFSHEGQAVQVMITTAGLNIKIQVIDQGIGIKPEEQPRLFQKFHRATDILTYDYEGTGLGLALANLIAKAHGGTISFTSQLGKGSTFTVELPLSHSQGQSA